MPTITPGPFLGSLPSPDIGGARLSRQLDLICSSLAILAGGAVWLGAWVNGPDYDVVGLTKASSGVGLAAALMGMVLVNTAAGWERLGVSLILEAVGRRLHFFPAGRAVRLAPEETPARGIAGLVEALVWRIRRLNAPPSDTTKPGDLYDAAVREGRAQAQQIVKALYQHADTLSEASGEIETGAQRLDADGRAAGTACAGAELAIGRTEQHLASLTAAVAATTAQLGRMTETAVALSDRAFAGQRGVAALDDGTARLLVGIGRIEGLAKRVGDLGVAAAATGGAPGAFEASVAAVIRELAEGMLTSLAALQADAATMSGQVGAALRTTQEICDWVTAQHELGLALSHAVSRQGEEVSAVLRLLEEARSGFVTLRASVAAVTRHGSARLAASGALREAAGRIPGHADAVAAILRDIPDFAASPRGEL